MTSRSTVVRIAFSLVAFTGCNRLRTTPDRPPPTIPLAPLPNVRPVDGMAVVRGRVAHGDVPVAAHEVWLCSHYVARTLACDDAHLSTRTDANGVFAFARVPPGEYMALVVPSGSARGLAWGEEEIRSIRAGDVLDVPVVQQITDDLVLREPARGATGVGAQPQFRWDAVPTATYYLVTVQSLSFRVRRPFPYLRQRYTRAGFTAEAPLDPATYTWFVESFDARDRPLSRSATGAFFTIGERRDQ